jgi:hypothetical protein
LPPEGESHYYQERANERRAFNFSIKIQGKKKGTFQKGSQRKPNTKGTFKGKSNDTSKIKCFSCNKLGHFAKDCWFRKKYPRKRKHHASTVEDDESKRKQKSPSNEKENRK